MESRSWVKRCRPTPRALSDVDGLEDVVFQYQWLAGDADIAGVTGSNLHRCVRRRGQGHQGEGRLHRRRGQRGDADQRAHRGNGGGACSSGRPRWTSAC